MAFTTRLNTHEQEKLDAIQLHFDCKTASATIKLVIVNFLNAIEEQEEERKKTYEMKMELDKLKELSRNISFNEKEIENQKKELWDMANS